MTGLPPPSSSSASGGNFSVLDNTISSSDEEEEEKQDDANQAQQEKRSDVENNEDDDDNDQLDAATTTTTTSNHRRICARMWKSIRQSWPRGGYHSAVERLPKSVFFRDAVELPQYLLRWFMTLNAMFLTVWGASALLASLITWYVVYFLWLGAAWLFVLTISRTIVYPAGNVFMTRKIEFTLAEEVSRKYEEYIDHCLSSTPLHPQQRASLERLWTVFFIPTATSLEAHHHETSSSNTERDAFITALKRFCAAHANNAMPESASDPNKRQEFMLAAQALRPLIRPVLMGTIPVDTILSPGAPHHPPNPVPIVSASSHQRNPDNKVREWWIILSRYVIAYISCLFAFPGLGSFAWLRTHMRVIMHGEPETIGYVNGMFIPSHTTSSSRTMILSSGNASIYETAALFPGWCEFYRKRGINVFLYNYRGYVASSGRCSPASQRADMKAIITRLKTTRGNQCEELGCHGESIGGVPSCYGGTLDDISLLICDRAFSSLHEVACCFVGPYLAGVLHTITRWNAENVGHYMMALPHSGHKLILQDPDDHIVQHRASLKIGVALAYVKKQMPTRTASVTPIAESDVEEPMGGGTHALATFLNDNVLCSEFVHAAHCCLVSVSRPTPGAAIEGYHVPDPLHAEKLVHVSFPESTDLELMQEMFEFARLLLHVDGGHGITMGKALNEDIQLRFEDAKPTRKLRVKFWRAAQPPPPPRAKIPPRAMQGWFACSKVWHSTPPPTAHRGEKTTWRLMNETGIFSVTCGIPLLTCVDVMKKFYAAREARLQAAGLKDIVATVVTGFTLLADAIVEPSTVDDMKQKTGKLVSLRCGHNGMPSPTELHEVEEFMVNAGWWVRG